MRTKLFVALLSVAMLIGILTGCGQTNDHSDIGATDNMNGAQIEEAEGDTVISLTSEIIELEEGFFAVRYEGDYGFDDCCR